MTNDVSTRQENSEMSLLVLLGAGALALLLSVIPFASWLTYPIALFSTFIHEAGHALAALFSFGDVHHLQVNADTSGVTYTSGGSRFLISSAGYLGTTLYGVLLLLSTQKLRWAKNMLYGTGATVLVLTAFYAAHGNGWLSALLSLVAVGMGFASFSQKLGGLARAGLRAGAMMLLASAGVWLWLNSGLLTWALGVGCGLALLATARFTGGDVLRFLTAFLGLQVALDSVHSVVHLVGLSTIPMAHSDAHNMANTFGLPAAFWALFWCCLSVLMVGAAVIFLFWRGRKAARA